MYTAGAKHLDSLLDDDLLAAGSEAVADEIGDGAAGGRTSRRIFTGIKLHACVPLCC